MQDVEDWTRALGFPTEAEMWKQHSQLIEAELCIVQAELSKARRDLKRLADMYQATADELSKLKAAYEVLGKAKNTLYLEYVHLSNKLNFAPRQQRS